MKRFTALVALGLALCIASSADAQFSINTGYLGSTLRQKVTYAGKGLDTTMSMSNGFYAGLTYNVKTDGPLGISVGAYISYGMHSDRLVTEMGPMKTVAISELSIMEFAMPLHLSYKYDFSDDVSLIASAGPTLQVGLQGQQLASTTVTVMGMEQKTSFSGELFKKQDGESGSYLTRFDISVTLIAGIQYKKFRMQAGYNLGTLDRCGYADGGNYSYDFHINQFFAGVGYTF